MNSAPRSGLRTPGRGQPLRCTADTSAGSSRRRPLARPPPAVARRRAVRARHGHGRGRAGARCACIPCARRPGLFGLGRRKGGLGKRRRSGHGRGWGGWGRQSRPHGSGRPRATVAPAAHGCGGARVGTEGAAGGRGAAGLGQAWRMGRDVQRQRAGRDDSAPMPPPLGAAPVPPRTTPLSLPAAQTARHCCDRRAGRKPALPPRALTRRDRAGSKEERRPPRTHP
jgi:hypothetical protein